MLAAAVFLFAAAAATPKSVAPEIFPHSTALFLASLSNDGKDRVVFRAQAVGTYYFFEEPGGVSVYSYDGAVYRREKFLKGKTLAQAVKQVTGNR
jgi:hypothetical protein